METIETTKACASCSADLSWDESCRRCLLDEIFAEDGTNSGIPPLTKDRIALLFPEWEVLGILGQGGMGMVFEVRQPRLDRIVALKVMSPNLAVHPELAIRFRREARAMAQLRHEGIVTIHDFGERDLLAYLLMERIPGSDLSKQLNQIPLPLTRVIEIMADLCEAITYAHEEKIIHRDLKPGNILIDRAGRAIIADFGLSKAFGEDSDISLTATYQQMGTATYRAPELGDDYRRDLYSLGAICYELLTGKHPNGAFPPPSQMNPEVTPKVDLAIYRALSHEPEERHASAAEFFADIC